VYKRSVRRRRAVLALLVGLSIALLTAYFGESASGSLHAIQRGFLEALAPLQEGASRALKPGRDLVGWVGDAFDAKSENKQLRKQVRELQTRLAQSETASRDASELRSLVGFNRSSAFPTGYSPVSARVIARSPTVWYSAITIDKGSDQGVRVNQPVISGSGLVGKISDVAPDAARVTLLTDHTSGVSAQVVPNGANGLVKATVGNPSDLLLDFVQKGKAVPKGATVITSGWKSSHLESLFPRGIPIGSVTRSDANERALYQRVHLHPYADLRNLDVVEVLTHAGPDPSQKAQLLP
jgi:rod shape-determining protein MreC